MFFSLLALLFTPLLSCVCVCMCVAVCVVFEMCRVLLADGYPEGREVAQGLPQKGLRTPGDGREGRRAGDVPTRPRDRTQE